LAGRLHSAASIARDDSVTKRNERGPELLKQPAFIRDDFPLLLLERLLLLSEFPEQSLEFVGHRRSSTPKD
jgi:hypothetical protein